MLPEIHKPQRSQAGRPVISACGCQTERISTYIHYHIRISIQLQPSYIKDNSDLFKKIDITSLYTSIPHEDGVKGTCKILEENQHTHPNAEMLLAMMNLMLQNNIFKFGKNYYK